MWVNEISEAQHLLGTWEAYLCHFAKRSLCHQVLPAPLWGLVTLPNVPDDVDAQGNQAPEEDTHLPELLTMRSAW